MESILLDEIFDRRKQLNFDVLKIQVNLPIEAIYTEVETMLSQYKPAEKDGYEKYMALGLQYADETNPIYDCIQQSNFITPDGMVQKYRSLPSLSYIQKNELADRLKILFDIFQPFYVHRGRILVAKPGLKIRPHSDGVNSCKIHIPVVTNDKSIMGYEKQSYHLPADGSAYLCNTERPHYIQNSGSTNRIHIVLHI